MPTPKLPLNKSYGLWLVLHEVPPSIEDTYDANPKGHRRRLICLCRGCDVEYSVMLENLSRGKSRGCSKCRARGRIPAPPNESEGTTK